MSTPVRQQYLALKAANPEALLFFRLGDFYELFDADAEIASRELQLTLTGREIGQGQRVPMAGVPHHHADTYIARLIARGYKVAVAEQIGDPRNAKGLVERRIVRVITPGTIQDPELLEAGKNNYLAAIVPLPGAAGLAYADITTGEFIVQHLVAEDMPQALLQELLRIAPAECLWPLAAVQSSLLPSSTDAREQATPTQRTDGQDEDEPAVPRWPADLLQPISVPNCHMTPFPEEHFAAEQGRKALLALLGLESLEGRAFAPFDLAIGAAGALLAYLRRTQPAAVPILRTPVLYRAADHMTLDAPTRRNLELTQTMRAGAPANSLLGVLDRTRTPMGGRLLRRWLNAPLVVLPPLRRRQQAVATLADGTALRLRLLDALSGIGDIDRLVCRAQQGSATPRELLALARALERLQGLAAALAALPAERPDGDARTLDPNGSSLCVARDALDSCDEVVALIKRALVDDPPAAIADGGFVRPGYAPAIDAIDEGSREAREWLASLEAQERVRTGIRGLKVVYNRIFGYALEVSKANLAQVPDGYVRKQTVAGGERYITPELKQREAQLLQAQERRGQLELEVLQELREAVAAHADRMLRSADAVGMIDVYAAFASVALEHDYCRPDLDEGDRLAIEAGRHPVVEVTQREVAFVPNDLLLDAGCRLIVLTGPNMAGKSTYLRQVALIVLLAQVGSFVPARSARLGLVDRIFTRVGAQDDLASGQSTFMVEMAETSAILAACTPRSLLILDEIGRGTSTYDGLAIAQAVLEYLHDDPGHRAKTVFATHYHELTALAERRPHVANFRMEVLEDGDRVVFLRRVAPGGADKSYGVHVAELAGLPPRVVHRARSLLREFEHGAQQGARTARRKIQESTTQQLALFDRPGEPGITA